MCFLINGEIYLLCQLAEKMNYIHHLHAYNVQFGITNILTRPDDLYDYYPLGIYEAGSMSLITLRHYVPKL